MPHRISKKKKKKKKKKKLMLLSNPCIIILRSNLNFEEYSKEMSASK